MRLGWILFAVFWLSGCAAGNLFQPYPVKLNEVKTQLNQGSAQAMVPLESGLSGADSLLYAQEAGRVALLDGQFDNSQNLFDQAITEYQRRDWTAIISASELGSQAAASTVSELLVPYHGQAYERILVHQYQSLNYLFQGDITGANVEARRAEEAQKLALQAYQDQPSVRQMNNANVDSELARMSSQTPNALNSFLNSYTLVQNAVLFEAQGEDNDALIDIRKALQAYPKNIYLQQAFVRLSCELSIDCDKATQRYGKPKALPKGQGRVVALVETGYVPAKQAFTLPLVIDGYYQQLSMPTYRNLGPNRSNVSLSLMGSHNYHGEAGLIGDIDQLASRSLQEQYPGILLRQGLRIAAKAGTNQWADKKGGELGSVAMQLFNAVTEQADRRSWLTLPKQAWWWPQSAEPGTYQFRVEGSTAKVQVLEGKTTLVWAAQTGNQYRIHSVIL